ncbi:MAG: hypothetical protein WKG01_31260 [Kofleriaceae bacterium]
MPRIRTYAIICFVVAVALVGVLVGTRSTIVDGRVMAGYLRASAPVERCSDAELTPRGAVFHCTITGSDASHQRSYFMDRDGRIYDGGNSLLE